jgi:hypothetical protein
LFSGCPRKKAAPAISKPITDPRFQSSVAPRAFLYQAAAAGASVTANITVITRALFSFTISLFAMDIYSFEVGVKLIPKDANIPQNIHLISHCQKQESRIQNHLLFTGVKCVKTQTHLSFCFL